MSYEVSVDVEGSNIQCSCCSERNVCLSVIEPLTVSFELYSCQVSMYFIVCVQLLVTLAACKLNVMVWHLSVCPFVCLSVPSFFQMLIERLFSNLNRVRGTYST